MNVVETGALLTPEIPTKVLFSVIVTVLGQLTQCFEILGAFQFFFMYYEIFGMCNVCIISSTHPIYVFSLVLSLSQIALELSSPLVFDPRVCCSFVCQVCVSHPGFSILSPPVLL